MWLWPGSLVGVWSEPMFLLSVRIPNVPELSKYFMNILLVLYLLLPYEASDTIYIIMLLNCFYFLCNIL